MTPISIRVRELREQRGWSQAELCRRSGVRQATLSAIENEQTKGVDFETLEKLAEALEVHAAVLIEQLPLKDRQRYKGFVIVAKTRKRVKSGKWTLAIQIEHHRGAEIVVKPYNARDTFESRKAAVEGCFVFGRHIIDRKVPGLTPP